MDVGQTRHLITVAGRANLGSTAPREEIGDSLAILDLNPAILLHGGFGQTGTLSPLIFGSRFQDVPRAGWANKDQARRSAVRSWYLGKSVLPVMPPSAASAKITRSIPLHLGCVIAFPRKTLSRNTSTLGRLHRPAIQVFDHTLCTPIARGEGIVSLTMILTGVIIFTVITITAGAPEGTAF